MALKEGVEHYTAFTFVENGEIRNRRLHRIEFQDRAGKVHILEGKDLPNFVQVNTGTAQKGHHVGTILLEPEKATSSLIPKWEAWPSHRDLLNGLAAVVLFMMLQHFVHIASALP
jgi:hypothetical protein